MVESLVVDDPCEEQRKLAEAVAVAVQRVYAAKAAHAQALKDKGGNLDSLASALAACRAEERRAVKALDGHKRDHDCGMLK
jgi:hypothetical protein